MTQPNPAAYGEFLVTFPTKQSYNLLVERSARKARVIYPAINLERLHLTPSNYGGDKEDYYRWFSLPERGVTTILNQDDFMAVRLCQDDAANPFHPNYEDEFHELYWLGLTPKVDGNNNHRDWWLTQLTKIKRKDVAVGAAWKAWNIFATDGSWNDDAEFARLSDAYQKSRRQRGLAHFRLHEAFNNMPTIRHSHMSFLALNKGSLK